MGDIFILRVYIEWIVTAASKLTINMFTETFFISVQIWQSSLRNICSVGNIGLNLGAVSFIIVIWNIYWIQEKNNDCPVTYNAMNNKNAVNYVFCLPLIFWHSVSCYQGEIMAKSSRYTNIYEETQHTKNNEQFPCT